MTVAELIEELKKLSQDLNVEGAKYADKRLIEIN